MADQLQIANWALMLIGERRLSSLADDSANAEHIVAAWDMLRDRLLRRHAWNFAIERDEIAADSDAPLWGYSVQYTLPGNVLRAIQIGEFHVGLDLSPFRDTSAAEYRLEGRKILCDEATPLRVRYIVNDKPVGEWDASFAALMAAELADHITPRVTQSEAVAQRVAAWRFEALQEAAAANAIETVSEHIADDSFIAAHQL